MAKVTGPLLSFDASGTMGKTATFSKWKGRNYTRLRVIPRNPQSEDQAKTRTILGAIGKTGKQIVNPSTLYTQLLAVVPQDQSWISYLASTIAGSNFATFDAVKAFYDNVANAVIVGYFDTEAPDEGLTGFELSYGTYGEVSPGLQLMAAYKAAFILGLAVAPVDIDAVSNGDVQAFGAAFLA